MLHGEVDRLENRIAVKWFVSGSLTRVTQLVILHFVPAISDLDRTAQGYTEEQGHGPEDLSHYVTLYLQLMTVCVLNTFT